MDSYTYQPLSDANRQIRLAKWLGHDESGCQQWSLLVYEFERAPPYRTISYVWGDPNDTAHVKLDGKALSIPRNLQNGLSQCVSETALQRYNQDGDTLFWADALCINQVDDQEKTAQVHKMFEIYGRTIESLGWLGECSSRHANFLSSIDWSYLEPCRKDHSDNRHCADCTWYVLGSTPVLDMKSIKGLFLNPFWTRVWIIQEMLAPTTLVFLMSHVFIPDSALYKLAVYGSLLNISGGPFFALFKPKCQIAKRLLEERNNRVQARPNHTGSLRNVSTMASYLSLIGMHWYQASDPRDLIYAVLGLHQAPDLRPDYSVTYYTACVRTAAYLIQHGQAETVLNLIEMNRSNRRTTPQGDSVWREMPSWVPDWRADFAMSALYINPDELASIRNRLICLSFVRVGEVEFVHCKNDKPFQWVYLSTHHPTRCNDNDKQLWFKWHDFQATFLMGGDTVCLSPQSQGKDLTILRFDSKRGSYSIEGQVGADSWSQCRSPDTDRTDSFWEIVDTLGDSLADYMADFRSFPEETFRVH